MPTDGPAISPDILCLPYPGRAVCVRSSATPKPPAPMLDPQFVRDHPDRVRQALRDKAIGDPSLVDRVLDLDARRRTLLTEAQTAQAASNAASKQIGALMQSGQKDDAAALRERVAADKTRVKALEEEAARIDDDFRRAMLDLPNVPHASVPLPHATEAPGYDVLGHTDEGNVMVFETGERPAYVDADGQPFTPKPHWEIVAALAGQGAGPLARVDFERGAKVTGAGFPFYVGPLARLQRALIAFFLDRAGEAGYVEVQPPVVVNEASGIGTGQLPDKEGQMYAVPGDGLYLVPTAEVPVTNALRDDTLAEADLPLRLAAYTPCFRREAGSYGAHVRGLNRLHQFDKVELVQFVHPDRSYEALEALREDAERLIQALGLPYRRLLMCTGDLGFTQSKKYDLEVWSGAQQRWLEVSSVSNFEAFQARRANVRYKPAEGGKATFVHTLNGSGLALPRIVAAILEHHQQYDGSVVIPDVLRPYTGFDRLAAA